MKASAAIITSMNTPIAMAAGSERRLGDRPAQHRTAAPRDPEPRTRGAAADRLLAMVVVRRPHAQGPAPEQAMPMRQTIAMTSMVCRAFSPADQDHRMGIKRGQVAGHLAEQDAEEDADGGSGHPHNRDAAEAPSGLDLRIIS